jgi:hypothetical protein
MHCKINSEFRERVSDSIHPPNSLLPLCWTLTSQPQDISDLILIQLT